MANILLIDDDDLLSEGLAEGLRGAGHSVTLAPNGPAGLAAAARILPDIVITDVLMPGMDGIEVLRTLRARGFEVPVIAMSGGGRLGAGMVLDMVTALGAAGVLVKPFSRQELLALVTRCLTDRVTNA